MSEDKELVIDGIDLTVRLKSDCLLVPSAQDCWSPPHSNELFGDEFDHGGLSGAANSDIADADDRNWKRHGTRGQSRPASSCDSAVDPSERANEPRPTREEEGA